jgi:hypothetical protein
VAVRLRVTDAAGRAQEKTRTINFLDSTVGGGQGPTYLFPLLNACLTNRVPVAKVKIPVQRASVDLARAIVSVVGDCSKRPLACLGDVSLAASVHASRASAAKAKRHRRSVTVGRAPFFIRAGKKARVKVRLTRRGRALLRRAHPRRLTLIAANGPPGTRQTKTKRVLRVKYKKRAHRRLRR